MASVSKKEIVHIDTTPTELRKLADKMEQQIKKAKLGDSTTVETWVSYIDVEFAYDQGKVPKNEQPK